METFDELSRRFGITGTVQETMCDEFYRQGYLAGQAALAASPVPAPGEVGEMVKRLRDTAQGISLGADGMGWSPEDLLVEAADLIEAMAAVGVRQERQIMEMERAAPVTLNGLTESAASVSAHAQQASTPKLGALAERTIFDAIRGAYDLGYNDARNARTVPGDSAPGYQGRTVEGDHGGALAARLNQLAAPAPSVEAQAVDLASFCDAVFKAAINCGHSISDKRITLNFDKGSPGHNALNQLHRRLYEAVRAALKEPKQ